ncbi:MAG: PA14 domain-containing protein [Limisphaerales bacterium]
MNPKILSYHYEISATRLVQFNPQFGRRFCFAGRSSISPLGAGGNLPWEIWALIDGSSVADLTNSGALSNPPDAVYTITNTFDTFNVGKTDDHNDQYGSRIRGFLQVPETGTYQLFLSSADASQLSLSPDFNPANLVVVAQETNSVPRCSAVRDSRRGPRRR